MSALPAIHSLIDAGRPVILGCDPAASLREIGASTDGLAPLGRLLREDPTKVAEHYSRETKAGVDALLALTSDTMPRALAHIGMAFRAAALTRCAVELAIEAAAAADRRVAVAGVLGNRWVESMIAERIAEECSMHAARLSASGCEFIVARGFTRVAASPVNLVRLARVAAVVSARTTRLPTWVMVELEEASRTPDGEALEDCVGAAIDAGAELILIEAPRPDVALSAMKGLAKSAPSAKVGVLLRALPGSIDAWAEASMRLFGEGARVLGGGLGTSIAHIAALRVAEAASRARGQE